MNRKLHRNGKRDQIEDKVPGSGRLILLLILAAVHFFCVNTDTGELSGEANRPEILLTYTIVDTGQERCYGNSGEIQTPRMGDPFFGQDAQHAGAQPSYRDNGDGTITDLNTGLMWVQARGVKVKWEEAKAGAGDCRIGGYEDWRMPAIKELYSLIDFRGKAGQSASDSIPYIDTAYFDFEYGNVGAGERLIDCQDWSATEYIDTTMNGDTTVFGVNFADGRIKGYPKMIHIQAGLEENTLYVRYVRGNSEYGINRFKENGDGTVTDEATGLVWCKADSGSGKNWQEALAWGQSKNAEKYLGYEDWRLPNAKEIQSIVDYTRAPRITGSAAIDSIFDCTPLIVEGGQNDFPFFWTSTTHLDNDGGVYIAFGRAFGFMEVPPNSGSFQLLDVHGAGAQRSDPKAGNPADYPLGKGPQGDVIRIYNFIRLVRDYR